MLNVLLFDSDAATGVGLPRVHHQWMPDELLMERKWYNDPEARELIESLQSRGHTVKPSGSVGNVQLIRRDPRRGHLDAACDPRKGGKPAGF
jgi:gamma-glutamyltranspeptidase/glutathione hydrolase